MRLRPRERGFSLLMAMLVVVVSTLLVVGAIAFTGTERTTAVVHTRGELASSCAHAARNLFISKIRVLRGNTGSITVDEFVTLPSGEQLRIETGHYQGLAGEDGTPQVELNAVSEVSGDRVKGADVGLRQGTNVITGAGSGGLAGAYYNVVATCEDTAGRKREVEFLVKVGI